MLLRLTFPVSLADVAKIESPLEKAAGAYYEHLADQQHELHMYFLGSEAIRAKYGSRRACVTPHPRLTRDGKICRDF
jgi:hypothetical protein